MRSGRITRDKAEPRHEPALAIGEQVPDLLHFRRVRELDISIVESPIQHQSIHAFI